MNAFTSKEYTCFYARVLDDDLPLAVDIVCDLVTSSLIRRVTSTRSVASSSKRSPCTRTTRPTWSTTSSPRPSSATSPLGRPVLGSVESIESIGRGAIAGYYRRRYRPQDMVVAVAGNIDHATVVRFVEGVRHRGRWSRSRSPAAPRPGAARPPARGSARRAPHDRAGQPRARHARREPRDDRRFALGVLNAALGGGMSSRLFQEVREKRGLAYSVYSYHAQYADTGLFGIYAGCVPRKVDDVLAICRERSRRSPTTASRPRSSTGKGPAAWIAGPGSGRHRLADEPHRQGRARLWRAALRRQHHRPHQQGQASTTSRGRRRAC